MSVTVSVPTLHVNPLPTNTLLKEVSYASVFQKMTNLYYFGSGNCHCLAALCMKPLFVLHFLISVSLHAHPFTSLHVFFFFFFPFLFSGTHFFFFIFVNVSTLCYTQLLQLDFTCDAPALQKPLSLSTTLTSNYKKSTAHHTCLVKLCPCDWKNYCLCIFMIHL